MGKGKRGRSASAGGVALRAEMRLVLWPLYGGSAKFGLGLSVVLGSYHVCGLAHPCASRDSVPWTTWNGV